MILRNITPSDMMLIEALNEQQPEFKINLGNSIVDRIVMDNDKVVGYGIVKNFAEAVILLNNEASLLSRLDAMDRLMSVAVEGTKKKGIEQLHCFVNPGNQRLLNSLKKRYDFIETKDLVLVRNI